MRKLLFFLMIFISYSAIVPPRTKSTRTPQEDYTQNYLYYFSNDPKAQSMVTNQKCDCLKVSLRVYCKTCDKAAKYCYESFCNYPPNLDPDYHGLVTSTATNAQDIKKLTSEVMMTKQTMKS